MSTITTHEVTAQVDPARHWVHAVLAATRDQMPNTRQLLYARHGYEDDTLTEKVLRRFIMLQSPRLSWEDAHSWARSQGHGDADARDVLAIGENCYNIFGRLCSYNFCVTETRGGTFREADQVVTLWYDRNGHLEVRCGPVKSLPIGLDHIALWYVFRKEGMRPCAPEL